MLHVSQKNPCAFHISICMLDLTSTQPSRCFMLTPFQKKKGNTENAKTFISIKSTYSVIVINTQISVPATVGGCQSVGGFSWEMLCLFVCFLFYFQVFCEFFVFCLFVFKLCKQFTVKPVDADQLSLTYFKKLNKRTYFSNTKSNIKMCSDA